MDFTSYLEDFSKTTSSFFTKKYNDELDVLITSIKKCIKTEGTIYVISDQESKFAAQHLAEELQVRYIAGSQFNRADRPALPCQNLTDAPSETIIRLTPNFQSNDVVVGFFATKPNDEWNKCIKNFESSKKNLFCIGEGNFNKGINYPSTLKSDQVRFYHRVTLHLICDGFEQEFQGTEKSIAGVSESLVTLFNTCLATSSFIDNVESFYRFIKEKAQSPLFFIGNGGSACDAYEATINCQNKGILASEFLAPGFLTCAYNDGFSVFRRGVETINRGRNILIALSTSGNSRNIIDAVKLANEKKIHSVGLLGKNGGSLKNIVNIPIIVPSDATARIQEIHQIILSGITANSL